MASDPPLPPMIPFNSGGTAKPIVIKKLSIAKGSTTLEKNWDPDSRERACENLETSCVLRIKRDIREMFQEPPPGVFIVPCEHDITILHALLIGVEGTPYEGGFFLFLIRFPPKYPFDPPKVKLLTTGDGEVRFNPNLYKNGKVCLSILGTWAGPPWSSALTTSTVLISIQSLMNENPYHNEPGLEKELTKGAAAKYNKYVQYETLRVAVSFALDGLTRANVDCPDAFKGIMERHFMKNYDRYKQMCESLKQLNGKQLNEYNFFRDRSGTFEMDSVLTRLTSLRSRLEKKYTGISLDDEDSGFANLRKSFLPSESTGNKRKLEDDFDYMADSDLDSSDDDSEEIALSSDSDNGPTKADSTVSGPPTNKKVASSTAVREEIDLTADSSAD